MTTFHGLRRLASWAWLVVLVVGVALYIIVLRALVSTQNPNFVPTLILLGSAVVPASVLVYAEWPRTVSPVRSDLVLLVALVGGIIGTVSAGVLEYKALKDLGMLPMLGVGLIEEATKLVVPALVLLVVQVRTAATGLVLGIASGAGFAVLETMGYAFTALVSTQGNLDTVDNTLLARGLLSPAGHIAWTGLAAAALWRFAAGPTGRSALGFVGTFAAVVVLHGAWDSFNGTWPQVVIGLVSFVALMTAVHRARRDAELTAGRRGAVRGPAAA